MQPVGWRDAATLPNGVVVDTITDEAPFYAGGYTKPA
jgi:hypothetical protein